MFGTKSPWELFLRSVMLWLIGMGMLFILFRVPGFRFNGPFGYAFFGLTVLVVIAFQVSFWASIGWGTWNYLRRVDKAAIVRQHVPGNPMLPTFTRIAAMLPTIARIAVSKKGLLTLAGLAIALRLFFPIRFQECMTVGIPLLSGMKGPSSQHIECFATDVDAKTTAFQVFGVLALAVTVALVKKD